MARFLDANGYWVDTEEEEDEATTGRSFYESLVPTMNFSENESWKNPQGATPEAVLQNMAASDSRIATLTSEIRANVDVNSSAGQDALRALLADQQQDKEVRAAASQALYPSLQASIGREGELSFTAAPGADLSADYATRSARSNPELAARTKPALERMDEMFSNIQNLESTEDILAAYSEIQVIANEFLVGKKAQYESQLSKPLGIGNFDTALANSRAMDRQAWDAYYGGANLGDSDETMALIARQSQIKGLLEEQVGNKLRTDPDAVAISSRMKWLDSLVQDRLGSLDEVTQVGLVNPASVDAVAEGMGRNPNELTVKERTTIASNIVANDSQTMAAMQIGQASVVDLLNLAATSSGRPTIWATEALNRKFDTPEIAGQLVQAVKNFDTMYLAGMTEEQAAEFTLGPRDAGLSGSALEAAKAEIQAKKIRHVLSDVNSKRAAAFEQSTDNWAPPQSSALAGEWGAVVEVAKAALPEDTRLSIQHIISGLNWELPSLERTEKIRALAEYIASQAGSVSDSKVLGPLALYSDPLQLESMINAIIVGQMSSRARSRIMSGTPIGNALYSEGLWGRSNR